MDEEAKKEENTADAEVKPEGKPAEGGEPQSTEQETKKDAAETPSEEVKPADSETPAESESSKPEAGSEKVEGEAEKPKDSEPTKAEGIEGLEEVKVISQTDPETASDISSRVSSAGPEPHKKSHISDSLMRFYKYMGLAAEEGEETHKVKKEVIKIDRAPYYERHEVLSKEIEDEKINSNMIQRKLAQYFKKKRMDHVLKESSDQFDSQQKYNKKLDAYGELVEIDTRERNAITSELTDLKEKRETKYHELIELFEELQHKEKETGTGLINTKTGKSIPDKLVDRLIRLQESQMETINTMRLKYIRLKDSVAEKQNYIAVLDKIDDDLYLKDYEQLKIENRSLEDKIEERDDELSKLRSKYQSNIEILAHIREKSSALDSDIDNLKDEIETIEEQSVKVREQLNGFKQQRDKYRNITDRLHHESGLLTETELLRHMEKSMEELSLLSTELEHLKEENKIKAQQIRNIRKNIELSTEVFAKKVVYKNVEDKTSIHPQLYKGRPSLFRPTLPENAFQDLKDLKFKSTFKRNRKMRKTTKIKY